MRIWLYYTCLISWCLKIWWWWWIYFIIIIYLWTVKNMYWTANISIWFMVVYFLMSLRCWRILIEIIILMKGLIYLLRIIIIPWIIASPLHIILNWRINWLIIWRIFSLSNRQWTKIILSLLIFGRINYSLGFIDRIIA